MRFDLTCDERLPPLAWLLRHERGEDAARVVAGQSVIAADDAFWEGVNPCFREPARTPQHHFPLCTGCVRRGDEIVAFTPGHIFDRLFMIRQDGRLLLSNSLPFLLKATGTRLHPRDLLYHWRFGVIQAHRQTAPLECGRLEFFHNTNVAISREHRVRCEPKPPSPDFNSFAEYKANMDALLAEIAAALCGQQIQYEPVSTISSGYDSAAAAVLAKAIGATRTLTISDSRCGEAGDDSGEPIARRLGMSASVRTRNDHHSAGLEAERLFYLYGLPEDIIFHAFADELRRTLLFTGHKGDTMWDINGRPVGSWSLDPGGATMQCFRLRMDFVHFPPAFLGWARHRKVIALSQSDEMQPWSVGTSYDRPIARRIVEEAGVPRDWFGVKKRAVSAMYGLDSKSYVSETELGVSREFAELLARHRRRWTSPGLELGMTLGNAVHGAMKRVNRALSGRDAGDERRSVRPGRRSLKSRLTILMGYLGNAHRAFWIPFSDLSFSPQVANELLAADYPDAEELWAVSPRSAALEEQPTRSADRDGKVTPSNA
ncbi:MAG: hypothetical protein JSS00_01410 [Proteobacteria bacterium]|nr:hypothetical protein [Pseudomonadota bacterium]